MTLKCLFGHNFKVALVDTGYHTNNVDDEGKTTHVTPHVLTYSYCTRCNERRFKSTNYTYSHHQGISAAKGKWLAGSNNIHMTKEAEILDNSIFSDKGIDALIKKFKADPHFKQLTEKNKMVEDALGEFETALKLCSNID